MEAISKKEISQSPANGVDKLLPELEEEKIQFKKIQSCFAEQFGWDRKDDDDQHGCR